MPRDPRTYYFDILTAIRDLEDFTFGESFESYQNNKILVYAVERLLSIIGEAVTQLHQLNLELPLTNVRNIRGFRNILIHNYARVSQAVVWKIIKEPSVSIWMRQQGMV